MRVSTKKYRSTDISGNYAQMATAFGGYGEKVTTPERIIPAIRRGIEMTREGVPALLEFVTARETEISRCSSPFGLETLQVSPEKGGLRLLQWVIRPNVARRNPRVPPIEASIT